MQAVIEEKKAEIEALCRRFHVRHLWLFGSALGSEYEPGRSDVDFGVEFEPAVLHGLARRFLELHDALENLLGTPVDLVELGAVSNPYVLRDIVATRLQLYGS